MVAVEDHLLGVHVFDFINYTCLSLGHEFDVLKDIYKSEKI